MSAPLVLVRPAASRDLDVLMRALDLVQWVAEHLASMNQPPAPQSRLPRRATHSVGCPVARLIASKCRS